MDDGEARVVRSEFATTDTDMVEHFLRGSYADSKLTITGTDGDFTFNHSMIAAPGFSSNRFMIGVDWVADALIRPDDVFTVSRPVRGRIAYSDTAYPDAQADTGDVVLAPPNSPAHIVSENNDVAVMQLDPAAVAAYATAMTGLDPDHLAFAAITPLTPSLAQGWTNTTTHIRNDVLADPVAAESPILLDQAFRTLAAALLSTFPNTALARATDPEGPPVRGDVSAAALRDLADYLEHHADQPIGPTDIAEHADAPYREVVEALRRRDGIHPAQRLWIARLRGVHRDLLAADPDTGSVAAIATRWGFTNAARFRVAYARASDGETPEDTMRR